MNRISMNFVKLVTVASLAVLGTAGCYGEVYGDPAFYPSDAVVATEDPVYFNGQATYYNGGRWFYRNGGRWSYYRSEPGYLRTYRDAHPAAGRRGGYSSGGRGVDRSHGGGRR